MNIVLEFLVFHIPWVVWAIIALAVVATAAYVFHVDSRHLIWIAGIAAAAVFSQSLARKGWQAKELRDIADANKAIDRAKRAREKQEEINRDPKNLRKPDRYMRSD